VPRHAAGTSAARVLVRLLRALLAVWILAVLVAGVVLMLLEGVTGMVGAVARDRFFLGAIGGVLLAYAGWERRLRPRAVALAAAAMCVAAWWALAWSGLVAWPGYAVLWPVGLVGAAAFAWRVAAGSERMRGVWRLRMRDALVIPGSVALTPFMLLLSSELEMVLDLHILAFEDTIGPRFSSLAVSAFQAAPWFGEPALVAYFLLPAGVALAMSSLPRHRAPLDVLLAFAALTTVGYALYWVFPVVGPRQLFGAFPYAYPAAGSFEVRAVELRLVAPRNGMPSLHTAWSLMIWFVAAGAAAPMRVALRVFAALNIAATMGAEDSHWITDLVVAVPMTVGVCAAAMIGTPMRGARLAAIVVGGVTTALALALLYVAIPLFQAMPVLSWLFLAATVLPSLAINARLWRAALDARGVAQEPRPSCAT
jgi:hypothetical protein